MRELCVYSEKLASDERLSVLTKRFEVSGTPDISPGDVIPPACIVTNWKAWRLKQGEVTHVVKVNGVWQVWIQTSTPPNILRACLEEAGWKEIFTPLPR